MDLQIQPPLPKRRDFRIGILGSGFVVNECHLPAYRKAGFNPVAIASRDRRNAERAAQRHGIPKVYDSYLQLLDDPSIEVLDIAVPPNAQFALIEQACARKTAKGILAQKPLGVNYREAAAAAILCKRAGIVLSVNQNMRHDQSVRAARTLLQNGLIGQPVFATIEMRGIPHWMPWQSELGWATLRVLSVHHLDCFRYWFGEPEAIYCSVRTDPRTKFPHTDGICTYILEYASGLRCVGIDDPWTGPAKEGCPADIYLRWRIEGLNGLAIGDIGWCRDPCTTPSTIKFAAKGDAGFHEPKWTESWFPDAFIGTMAQLLIALETGTEPAISAADNLKTMSLVDAACSSAQQLAAVNLKSFKVRSALVDGELEKPGIFSQLLSKPYAGSVKPEPEPVSNFTPRAQQVLALAREEAERFNHNFIGTEHLLIGLIALGQGVAVNVLAKLGLDLEKVRKEVEKEIGAGPDPEIIGNLSYTPRVRKVLAFASKEARNLKHTYVGTEHILLGLLREGDGVAADVLKNLGVDIERTRTEILKELDPKIAEAPRTLDETEIAGILKELDLKLEELRGKLGQTEIQKRGVLRRLVLKLSGSAGPPVFEEPISNFTPRAQQVLALARKEAERFNHNFVGTEHLLLGLIKLGQGTAVNVLQKLGLDLEVLCMEIETNVATGPGQKMIANIPHTPRVMKVLALASKEARDLSHTFIGTEHILLGLLGEGDGVAARVLKNHNVDIEQTRREILKELDPQFPGSQRTHDGTDPASEERTTHFTPRAHKALALARREADRLNHHFVGREHVLLGVIALGNGVAANVLLKLGLDLEKVRKEVEKQIGIGPDQKISGNISYTPGVRKVFAAAAKEAGNLNHANVGTEHILLGLLREGDGALPQVWKNLGVDTEKARAEILKELDPNFGK